MPEAPAGAGCVLQPQESKIIVRFSQGEAMRSEAATDRRLRQTCCFSGALQGQAPVQNLFAQPESGDATPHRCGSRTAAGRAA